MALLMRIRYRYTMFYVKPKEKDGLPHFIWWNHHVGSYQHYTFDFKCKPREWYKLLWFKGHVDGFPYEFSKNVKLVKLF